MIDYSYVLVSTDQPVTCPKCGARTETLLDLSHTRNQVQVHQCLSRHCNFKFVVENDKELIEA